MHIYLHSLIVVSYSYKGENENMVNSDGDSARVAALVTPMNQKPAADSTRPPKRLSLDLSIDPPGAAGKEKPVMEHHDANNIKTHAVTFNDVAGHPKTSVPVFEVSARKANQAKEMQYSEKTDLEPKIIGELYDIFIYYLLRYILKFFV